MSPYTRYLSLQPIQMHGGAGSYEGFAIPEKYVVTEFGRYAARVTRDSIVFTAVSVKDSGLTLTVVADSVGRFKWPD